MWSAEYDRQDLLDIADEAAMWAEGQAELSSMTYTMARGRTEVIQRVYRWEMTGERGSDGWATMGRTERRERIHAWLLGIAEHQPLRFADLVNGLDEEMAERARRRPEGMSDLKPCPFCGEPARIMLAPDDWVQCTGCGAMSAFSATPESAVRKWNRRADE